MYQKKVEYLKGLMSGLSLDQTTNEYKLFQAIVEALDELANALGDVEEDIVDAEEMLEDLEEDLESVTDFLDSIAEMAESLGEDGGDDNITIFPGTKFSSDEGSDNLVSEYEVPCPGCEHVFIVDEDEIAEGFVNCPSCSEKLVFEAGGGCGCEKCGGKNDKECPKDD